mmetsp:Transcript_22328/g.64112  ORF Transcript_22328/g.64112 Transcript_22328/m.64112 type:complete len:313 (-) Transcript_22328:618-1556(-)
MVPVQQGHPNLVGAPNARVRHCLAVQDCDRAVRQVHRALEGALRRIRRHLARRVPLVVCIGADPIGRRREQLPVARVPCDTSDEVRHWFAPPVRHEPPRLLRPRGDKLHVAAPVFLCGGKQQPLQRVVKIHLLRLKEPTVSRAARRKVAPAAPRALSLNVGVHQAQLVQRDAAQLRAADPATKPGATQWSEGACRRRRALAQDLRALALDWQIVAVQLDPAAASGEGRPVDDHVPKRLADGQVRSAEPMHGLAQAWRAHQESLPRMCERRDAARHRCFGRQGAQLLQAPHRHDLATMAIVNKTAATLATFPD